MIAQKNPMCYTPSMSKKMESAKKQKTSGKRGKGRPPVADPRVSLRVGTNESERARLRVAAQKVGLPLETWCRLHLLIASDTSDSTAEIKAIVMAEIDALVIARGGSPDTFWRATLLGGDRPMPSEVVTFVCDHFSPPHIWRTSQNRHSPVDFFWTDKIPCYYLIMTTTSQTTEDTMPPLAQLNQTDDTTGGAMISDDGQGNQLWDFSGKFANRFEHADNDRVYWDGDLTGWGYTDDLALA
jgi:hypothetical protein